MTEFEKEGIRSLALYDPRYYYRCNNKAKIDHECLASIQHKMDRQFDIICFSCLCGQIPVMSLRCEDCTVRKKYDELNGEFEKAKGTAE